MKEKSASFPTLLERTFVFLHMPFAVGAILVAVFVGPLGNFLYLYSVSHNAIGSLYGTFMSGSAEEVGFVAALQSDWFSLAGNILWYVFLFYVVFIISYLQMRLVKAEPELVSLAPNGVEDVHTIFKWISSNIPQIAIMSVFLFVYGTSVPELIVKGELNILSTPIYILRSSVRSLVFGSVMWLYCASLWGLYRFGRQNLKLKSYHEDSMLGTKKLGSLSFSFSLTYFIGLILFASQMILGGLAGQMSVVNVIFLLVLVPVGVALLIAPLASAHTRMLEAKRAEIAAIHGLLSELVGCLNKEKGKKDDQNMVKLLTLEAAERKVASIRTWPIENPLIGKLALVATSVSAALIARLIQTFLNI